MNVIESHTLNIFRSNRGKCITNTIEEIKQEQIADELISLTRAQSAPLFTKKHQENLQSPYLIL